MGARANPLLCVIGTQAADGHAIMSEMVAPLQEKAGSRRRSGTRPDPQGAAAHSGDHVARSRAGRTPDCRSAGTENPVDGSPLFPLSKPRRSQPDHDGNAETRKRTAITSCQTIRQNRQTMKGLKMINQQNQGFEWCPGGGDSVPPTGTSSVGVSSKTRGVRGGVLLSTGTKWPTLWSTVPCRPLQPHSAAPTTPMWFQGAASQ